MSQRGHALLATYGPVDHVCMAASLDKAHLSTCVQHALPVVLTQPPIDLHRKNDEVPCLATAAAPSYEHDGSKEQMP
jgi:hypothetical protein